MASMEKLQEVLNLARQTGDRVIILDNEREPFVVMNLDNYRSLLREEANVANVSEEELLNKINDLIATWKASQPDLSDYDLSQFRVESLRKEKATEQTVAEVVKEPSISVSRAGGVEPEYDYRKAEHENLLSQVVSDEDDEYLTEPEI